MRYLALDPGGETGYVVFDTAIMSGGAPVGKTNKIADFGTLGPEPHHQKLWRLILDNDNYMSGKLIIICERFDNRANPAAKFDSVEYIGIVKLYGQVMESNGFVPLIYWQGSSIKPGKQKEHAKAGWATDDKLQRAGLFTLPKTANRHVNDAARHLLYFLCHNPAVDMEQRQEWMKRVITPA